VTPDQAKAATKKLVSQVNADLLNRANLPALKDKEGNIKVRIHNKGLNSSGEEIGKYTSDPYVRRRAGAGRQTERVDLQFDGRLRDAFSVMIHKGRYVLGFDPTIKYGDLTSGELADIHEERYGPVWKPMASETRRYLKILNQQFLKEVKRLVATLKGA
jgi:hypothetical protein